MLRRRLTEMLTEPGRIEVMAWAATEADARAAIDAAEFDVLLVDVELREGTGIGAIRYARAHYPADRQPLIIVLTNYPWAPVRQRCLAMGANHFLDKMRQFEAVKGLIADAPRLPRG
jgi:CheY-like chemotaxis protein